MRKFNSTMIAALAAALTFGSTAFAAEAVNLDELLEQVSQGRVKDAAEAQARIEAFRQDRANQQRLLQEARNEQARQERLSDQLEQTFEDNDVEIIELERALQERLGDLKELFGVLQQGAGDAIGQFSTSITQVQFGERSKFLTEFAAKMGQSNRSHAYRCIQCSRQRQVPGICPGNRPPGGTAAPAAVPLHKPH